MSTVAAIVERDGKALLNLELLAETRFPLVVEFGGHRYRVERAVGYVEGVRIENEEDVTDEQGWGPEEEGGQDA